MARKFIILACLFFPFLNPDTSFGTDAKRQISINIKSDKQVYRLNENINVSLNIKNTSRQNMKVETLPSFLLASQTTFAFWVPVGLKTADVGFNTSQSSILELKPGHEKVFKYDLSKLKWNEMHSLLKTPLSLSALASPGEYTLRFSLAIILRPDPNNIRVQKTLNSNNVVIIFEGETPDLSGVKGYLTGMADKELKEYFDDCVAKNKIFIYTGGPGNEPLLDLPLKEYSAAQEFLITNKVRIISVGCMGGVKEAYKFNKLMFGYLTRNTQKKNQSN